MGFFSRIFRLDDGPGDSSGPAAGDTDIGLDAATSAAVLAELDIDTAIAAHENWKVRLQNYLDGKSSEDLKPEVVCLDDRCDLGKWLYGPGKMRLGAYPAFSILVSRHQYFHQQAADIVAQIQAGDKAKANLTLAGSYRYASSQVVLLLKELKRGLSR